MSRIQKKEGSILWVMVKKRRFNSLSHGKKKGSISLSHVEKKGSILWVRLKNGSLLRVMLKKEFNSLCPFVRKGSILWDILRSRFDSLSHFCNKKNGSILWVIFEKKVFKKGRRLQSMKESESAISAKRSKNVSETTKRKTRQGKFRRSWKNTKEQGTFSSIKSVKKRILIPKVKNKEWETIKTRQGIANVFAKFYEDLYEGDESDTGKGMDSRTEKDERLPDQHDPIPEFRKNEIQDAIDRLKMGKAKDNSGIRAEQLKNCSDETKEKIRTIFNEITRQEDFTPKSWRKIRIQVIYKKGDREEAGNYRPICSLPVVYKLFTTVLYARLAPPLHKIQPPDQGGFRPNHRTDDHLMVYRVLEQRCREWGVPLYISTIDFTKAFDRIKHSAIWKSLHYYGVEPAYVRLLQRLYSQQEGTVLTDKESDTHLGKMVQFFESFFWNKKQSFGPHLFEKGLILWVIFIEKFNSLSHSGHICLREVEFFKTLTKIQYFESYFQKKKMTLCAIFQKKIHSLSHSQKRRKVEFFKSTFQKKFQFFESY